MAILLIYILIFVVCFFAVGFVNQRLEKTQDFTSLKTVTFGDESAVRPNRAASILSIIVIFLLWGAFTGSKWAPIHAPAAYSGAGEFDYVVEGADGTRDTATVYWRVVEEKGAGGAFEGATEGEGAALNDQIDILLHDNGTLLWDKNDTLKRKAGALIVEVNGQAVDFDFNNRDEKGNQIDVRPTVNIDNGNVSFSDKGALRILPYKGWQMAPLYLPPPEKVVSRLIEISRHGYQNYTLLEHVGWSLFRVIAGFLCGALIGIPLGYAMGLSDWFRGWFDPIVEFMRPVPPLALIPLIIIWFGIGEVGKVILLFLAALWIMAIAARAGVSGVSITKVHAAYSLGASKFQIMRHVIMPNSLPEIFTGARVAMGVCWGTVVAAELVAANQGAGKMIMVAKSFQQTDIIIMGIILIGIIGFGIDVLMRIAEKYLVPWKGKS